MPRRMTDNIFLLTFLFWYVAIPSCAGDSIHSQRFKAAQPLEVWPEYLPAPKLASNAKACALLHGNNVRFLFWDDDSVEYGICYGKRDEPPIVFALESDGRPRLQASILHIKVPSSVPLPSSPIEILNPSLSLWDKSKSVFRAVVRSLSDRPIVRLGIYLLDRDGRLMSSRCVRGAVNSRSPMAKGDLRILSCKVPSGSIDVELLALVGYANEPAQTYKVRMFHFVLSNMLRTSVGSMVIVDAGIVYDSFDGKRVSGRKQLSSPMIAKVISNTPSYLEVETIPDLSRVYIRKRAKVGFSSIVYRFVDMRPIESMDLPSDVLFLYGSHTAARGYEACMRPWLTNIRKACPFALDRLDESIYAVPIRIETDSGDGMADFILIEKSADGSIECMK